MKDRLSAAVRLGPGGVFGFPVLFDGAFFVNLGTDIEVVRFQRVARFGSFRRLEDFSDFSAAREHIYMRLISYNRNKDRIEDYPYRKFLDLALVYYYAVFDDRAGVNGLIRIENDHLDMWGVSEDELYKIANENTFNKLS